MKPRMFDVVLCLCVVLICICTTLAGERVSVFAGRVVAKVSGPNPPPVYVKDGRLAGYGAVGAIRMRAPDCSGFQEVQFAAPYCSGGDIVEMKERSGRVDIRYRNGKSVHIRERRTGVEIDYDD